MSMDRTLQELLDHEDALRADFKELEAKYKRLERYHDALLLQNRWLKAHRQCPSCKGMLPMEPWLCSLYGKPDDYYEEGE